MKSHWPLPSMGSKLAWLGWALAAAMLIANLGLRHERTQSERVLALEARAPQPPVVPAQITVVKATQPIPTSARRATTHPRAVPSRALSVNVRELLVMAERDPRSQHAAYVAMADCANRLADWPIQQLTVGTEPPTPASRAASELMARCDGLTLDLIVRKATELRATLVSTNHPAAVAEGLADRYRAGATQADLATADQLRVGASAAVLEPLKAFYDAVNRGEPRIVDPVPYKYRAAADVAWQLVWCELGRDCSPQSREWLELCATRGVCGVSTPAEYAASVLPESEVQRAFVYRDMILASLAVGNYEGVGLAVDSQVASRLPTR